MEENQDAEGGSATTIIKQEGHADDAKSEMQIETHETQKPNEEPQMATDETQKPKGQTQDASSIMARGRIEPHVRRHSLMMFQTNAAVDVCLEVEPLRGVFYNTVTKYIEEEPVEKNEFEQDIQDRDPTRYFPTSARGFSGMLKQPLHETPPNQQIVWMIARYEAICQRLQETGNSLARIRAGNANMTRQQLMQLFINEREKLFGKVEYFPVGEPYLGMPPFTHFFKREELLYFGICQSPYDTVSVDKMRDGTEIAQAIILDGTPSLREDMGTRFILYCKFERGANEVSDYTDKNQPIFQSWIHEIPIRVVRGYNAISRYAPLWGFRYDGLYRIIGVYSDNNKQGLRVWSYVFSACNPDLEPPVFLQTDEGSESVTTTDPDLKSVFINHLHIHAKFQKSIKKKISEDLRQVDVVLNGKKLFTIGIPHLLRAGGRNYRQVPLVVNFSIIYRYIRRLCKVAKVGQQWLEGPVAEYEKAKKEGSTIWWARGGFLPMKLIIQYLEPRRSLSMEVIRGQCKEKITSKKVRLQKTLVINRELAKNMARPFFPQSDTDSIWTYIELTEPIDRTWNPYEDISAGSEVHPIPVLNEVDDDEPPMVFTYIRSNIYFSRLPNLNFDPVCAGCIPDTLDKETCQIVTVKGFCKGLMDPKGRLYCQGVNKGYLSTIQSRAACSDNCPCSNDCSNRLLEGVQVPVKLIKTPNMGWALHTMVHITIGTYIMQYVGEVVCRSEMMAREHQYDKLGRFNYCMEAVEMETLHDDWQMPCMDSMVLGNIARFLNHSCDPNVEVITVWRGDDFPCIAVYALRDIAAGEALTYCYGSQYKSIPCLCDARNCRGFIGNI
ncbi:SET domain containing protein, putative [Babesia bigemina]|uniref:SET domain containing protein, putative n=1 Tax=Babesia bigemina TaxID=5866 RepID=A0A061DB90_BABBI|nr:SET domain containing protein, putative [Babesia bigemina]CDR97961.1 SET domain containing protein, putative [Babesia bigemina]|eukprot:XP_012770147.1 SET domain containing protein, putative [Babesia bigemina]